MGADRATRIVLSHRLLRRYVLPGERVVLAARLDLLESDPSSALARLREYFARFSVELETAPADRLLEPSRQSALRVARGELLALLAIASRENGDPDAGLVARLAAVAGVDVRALSAVPD